MSRLTPLGVISVLVLASAGVFVFAPGADFAARSPQPRDVVGTETDAELAVSNVDPPDPTPVNVTAFESASDFTAYLRDSRSSTDSVEVVAERRVADGPTTATPMPTGTPIEVATEADGADGGGSAASPDRHSETNVQVEGVAEPDLVKTDGKHIYYAPRDGEHHHHHRDDAGTDTRVIDATPPGTAEVVADIEHSGRMFLDGDRLVVVGERVWGYNVSDPADPELVWTRALDSRVTSARMHNGTMYLVLASPVDVGKPCPVEPIEDTEIECTEIHHPDRPVPVDVTYTALTVSPTNGSVGDEFSVVGARESTVYMSRNGLYLTYTERTSRADVRTNVLLGEARPILPDRVVDHLREVQGYNLSERATAVEIEYTLRGWQAGLDEQRRKEVREQLHEATEAYVREHKRNLTTTHVVRVNTTTTAGRPTFSLAATGAVPGRPLNQFSVDEHDGALRVATTVGERWGTDSVNDVYVLDAGNLSVTGSVTDMGETERIYAVRFVGDRGYVVTFRRVDPFHVLDLSNASDPRLEGELKLPGYSSYLHPLGDDRVLGIGEEDGHVKTVIFDVSDPTEPTIEESRVLAADWSAVARTHHAFLLDEKHDVFFLPTERGGMVLSSTDLDTAHEVEVGDPQRALYIDDYLYVFGDDELAVVDETDWERVETVPL